MQREALKGELPSMMAREAAIFPFVDFSSKRTMPSLLSSKKSISKCFS